MNELLLSSGWLIPTLPLKLTSSKKPSLIVRVGQSDLLWLPLLENSMYWVVSFCYFSI